ncbi:MerR family transcriptional regulator [uncultured Brevundimonas sp.]|uniref:MerR family transcriptional regulator n=1 Tax=uncultured Brevundimonas sp. TaxID=213418 RepID=UPI0030EBB235
MAKGPNAFRTISEAANDIGTPQHVLRFWETKFSFVAPLKRAGGRRFYRPQDIVLLKAVRRLLHDDGLTIKGVQKLHRDHGIRHLAAYGDPDSTVVFEPAAGEAGPPASGADNARLRAVLVDIETARTRLEAVLAG